MAFVSVTRLKIRSVRFLAAFVLDALRTRQQVGRAPGFLGGSLLADRGWTFWTLTVWDDHDSMRGYMMSGAHRAAMPRLAARCDEASVVHWDQPDAGLPAWPEADRRMRDEGRPSRIRHPSPRHADMSFPPPRTFLAGPIPAAKPAGASRNRSARA